MGAKDPHVRIQSARDVVISLQAWLPLAEWQALGLGSERPKEPEVARTALAAPLSPALLKQAKEKSPARPARKGGLFGLLGRIFGR
jgi:hypothetical protein